MDQAYRFNSGSNYQVGVQLTSAIGQPSLTEVHVQVQAAPAAGFIINFPNVFEKYRVPNISSDKLVQAWGSSPMDFWQNQVNFAIWCATTGCGVSAQDHLLAKDPMMRSLYLFHAYYQTRRILEELQTPLPQDQAWNATNNPYDRRGYERVCSEFEVSPRSDWHVKGPNNGLGRVYNYWTNNGYHPVGEGEYNPVKMSFTKKTSNTTLHVDYIKQDAHNADTAWATFILYRSEGFTRPGVERLNDSIRTYVWAILGAQAQTRTGILGTGTAFDAQKQFLANIEDAISSPVDLPSVISRYQDVLQYAGSEVNYAFGIGLYMAPSDMLLRIGRVVGYNNEIVIATESQTLGLNGGLNRPIAPPDAANDTGEVGLVEPPPLPKASNPSPRDVPTAAQKAGALQHADEKTALVVGGIAIGLLMLWLLR